MASVIRMKQNDLGEHISKREKCLKEAEALHKRAVYREIRTELLRLANSRFGILSLAIAFLLVLGAGLGIYFFINDRIRVEMVRVDQKVMEIFHPIQSRENIPVETLKVHNQVMEKIRTVVKDELSMEKAAKLEEGLSIIQKDFYVQRENDLKMSRQFTEISQTQIHNLERALETMSQNLNKLVQSEEEFKRNAQYEVQITYEKGSENVVDYFAGVLRDQGFRISVWSNIRKIDQIYGVSMSSLENKISILSAPGESVIGEKIARIIREDRVFPVVRTGFDNAANSRSNLVGLVIPPSCSLPMESMKSSAKRRVYGNSRG
jgi:hypothetical protein